MQIFLLKSFNQFLKDKNLSQQSTNKQLKNFWNIFTNVKGESQIDD